MLEHWTTQFGVVSSSVFSSPMSVTLLVLGSADARSALPLPLPRPLWDVSSCLLEKNIVRFNY